MLFDHKEVRSILESFTEGHDLPEDFDLPCFFHINDPDNYGLRYMDPKYKNYFGVKEQDILEDGWLVVKTKVEPDDLTRAVQVCDHYQENQDQYYSISFIQRIKDKHGVFKPFFTTSRLAQGGLVGCSIQIDNTSLPYKKMENVLYETEFIRNNIQKFSTLTAREQEMLQKVALGFSWKQIATDFNVSYDTIKTYKKRIHSKLEINQFHELYYYARAFDVINH